MKVVYKKNHKNKELWIKLRKLKVIEIEKQSFYAIIYAYIGLFFEIRKESVYEKKSKW